MPQGCLGKSLAATVPHKKVHTFYELSDDTFDPGHAGVFVASIVSSKSESEVATANKPCGELCG